MLFTVVSDFLTSLILKNFEVTRNINMAELRKLRRQFISYTKMHPTENTGQIANMFVQYLNKSMHWLFCLKVNVFVICNLIQNVI